MRNKELIKEIEKLKERIDKLENGNWQPYWRNHREPVQYCYEVFPNDIRFLTDIPGTPNIPELLGNLINKGTL